MVFQILLEEIAVGGVPDGTIDADALAANAVTGGNTCFRCWWKDSSSSSVN